MIAFASRTGNVRYIISKLGLPNIEISQGLVVNQPFLLFTYTDGLGQTPNIVEQFLLHNSQLCKGVIASGNSNFGQAVFCKPANTISEKYNIPIVRKIELRGFQSDYDAIIEFYNKVIGLVGV
ncbi:class Ib ribonucleoside-diphosphate reductase assembly flavoprotein NrdI [Lysinibacillus telephonicus]|uniref:Class Ib ribonucleoside-diphosphate reductase assembly flavoprotein NrdI n=1 Tax=Lysinibacillus telephonicus TaxID=1714840 RepID=A0A431UI89_9BACI|nr:class Ib ribonucleoside-diphosphate reductase assembly flavoprotein NrdI [Lysinibacillus telephonicus]RTQ89457.1 class Ib ribonucleoside-diphosphate reductase assembly flavoprotein NrdI [Lysinibacillus telephonicus]